MDNNQNKKILILADDRTGTYSQSIALAKELGFEYDIVKINYSLLIKLPNFLLKNSLFGYDFATQKKLKNIGQYDIIISSGRRSVNAALYLRKKHQQVKIIQIMHPNINFKYFDLVILPQHDQEKANPKLIISYGALSNFDENKIKQEQEIHKNYFGNIKKKLVILLIGGPSKKTEFGKEQAILLAQDVNKFVNKIEAKLVILTSPRTKDEITQNLMANLDCDHDLFDFNKIDKNPYQACLGYGDYFIISGDSVSMISECCATSKIVFIYDDNKISSPKHRLFHDYLFKNNYAYKLEDSLKNDPKNTKTLNEAKRIALIIKDRFKL